MNSWSFEVRSYTIRSFGLFADNNNYNYNANNNDKASIFTVECSGDNYFFHSLFDTSSIRKTSSVHDTIQFKRWIYRLYFQVKFRCLFCRRLLDSLMCEGASIIWNCSPNVHRLTQSATVQQRKYSSCPTSGHRVSTHTQIIKIEWSFVKLNKVDDKENSCSTFSRRMKTALLASDEMVAMIELTIILLNVHETRKVTLINPTSVILSTVCSYVAEWK